jgi:hypothetical protein
MAAVPVGLVALTVCLLIDYRTLAQRSVFIPSRSSPG